jgi:beta-N-acetylhexosaminidase
VQKLAALLASFVLLFAVMAAAKSAKVQPPSLEEMIGQMVMVGFHGTAPEDEWPVQLNTQIEAGLVGGVIFYGYNIIDPDQTRTLIASLHERASAPGLWMALDQEGGQVQRLTATKGFNDYHSAAEVAATLSASEAHEHYRQMACEVRDFGFNFNFAPVVDLHLNPDSPAIGGLDRSFGAAVEPVVSYAAEAIKAHHGCGVLTSLKHFPGHGSAGSDSHKGLTDVTETFQPVELAPYEALIAQGLADSVMIAHVIDRRIDTLPASLSKAHIDRLRGMGFSGVVISDDLQMGAIANYFDFEETVLHAIEAGNDLLIFSNYFDPDPEIPHKVQRIVKEAIAAGRISRERIEESYRRVVALKKPVL